jgi:hypothetical protein
MNNPGKQAADKVPQSDSAEIFVSGEHYIWCSIVEYC